VHWQQSLSERPNARSNTRRPFLPESSREKPRRSIGIEEALAYRREEAD